MKVNWLREDREEIRAALECNFSFQSYKISAGKTLGGTSSINWLMYVRGNRRDFDQWEDMGNTGWGYEDVLKYFLKAENYQGTRHLNSGELRVV